MKAYRVSINDRERARTVNAESPSEALAAFVGKRMFSARLDSRSEDRAGNVTSFRYQVNIRNGRSVNGATPVLERWATVSPV